MKYTYKTIDGNFVVVEADDESEARHLAMEKRWQGRAVNILPSLPGNKYAGRGLELVKD